MLDRNGEIMRNNTTKPFEKKHLGEGDWFEEIDWLCRIMPCYIKHGEHKRMGKDRSIVQRQYDKRGYRGEVPLP